MGPCVAFAEGLPPRLATAPDRVSIAKSIARVWITYGRE